MSSMRSLFALAALSASFVMLAACGHGQASHLLPRGAGPSSGGVTGAHRKPRTINEAAYPNAVLADHPAAFYRLDDAGTTMSDAGPNSLTGTFGSAVAHGAGSLVPNTIDPAAGFAGGSWSATKIATVGQSSTLQPAAVSVEVWLSELSVNSGGFIDVVSYGTQSGQAYTLQLTPSNTLSWYQTTTSGSLYTAGSTVLTPGSAYHVVATYDGANAKIYVNGVLDGSAGGGASLSYAGIGTAGLSIGAGQGTTRNVFNGTLDDVSVFPAALSSTQVSAHYAAAQAAPDDPYALKVMADTPLAYYRLDDAGKTMYDATNNRINGTYGSAITKRVTGLVANTADTAAAFPGGAWNASSLATVPQTSALQPTSVSVEAWIKLSALNTSGDNIDFIAYGSQTGGRAYGLTLTAQNTVKLYIATGTGGAKKEALGATVLTAGNTYHVVGTYDGSSAQLYVNGNVDGSSSGGTAIWYGGIGTAGLSMGAAQNSSRAVLNGTIDEVAVYGTALTALQVSTHYTTPTWSNAQAGPPHIQTWAYLTSSWNFAVSMHYLLRHVDWVEAGWSDTALSNQFRAAGGRHASYYIDPGIVYYCNSPFGPTSQNTPGSCSLPSGPLGDPTLNSDESAWLHATQATTNSLPTCYASPAGARLHYWDSGVCGDPNNVYLWGEMPNRGSSHVRTAFASSVAAATSSSTVDALFLDDSSAHYDPSPSGGFIYQFGATPSEYDSLGSGADARFNSDVIGLACSAARPVFFNGPSWNSLDTVNGPTEKNDDSNFLRSPCSLGVSIEGAFVAGFRKSLNQHAQWNTFIPAANQALLAQGLGKIALMLNYTSCSYGGGCTFDPVGDRLYGLAGIWLVYDPRYSMAWNGVTQDNDPNMTDTDGNWDSMVAEYGIVPTQPVQTATGTNITTLQIPNGHSAGSSNPPGGAFRREFAQCYQDGASIGRCAVVLNAESPDYTSGGVISFPALSNSYSSSLVLNDKPGDAGGTATWTGSVPTTMQPMTAVILKQ